MPWLELSYYQEDRELVVNGHYPHRPEDSWSLTFRDSEGAFDLSPEVTLSYRQLAAVRDWPFLWSAWRQNRPETIKDLAALLKRLGVQDVTAQRESDRRQAGWIALVEEDTFEDGPVPDDPSDLPPDPHPDDYPLDDDPPGERPFRWGDRVRPRQP